MQTAAFEGHMSGKRITDLPVRQLCSPFFAVWYTQSRRNVLTKGKEKVK